MQEFEVYISNLRIRQDLPTNEFYLTTSANCNGDRYRCSPNAPHVPFRAIAFPLTSFINILSI